MGRHGYPRNESYLFMLGSSGSITYIGLPSRGRPFDFTVSTTGRIARTFSVTRDFRVGK